jgi:hypothetical protein
MARISPHTAEQIQAAVREIREQTDRGSVIVGAAMIEEMLAVVLQSRMTEMNRTHYDAFFGLTGPGGSLSNKIELLYGLGLCNESFYGLLHNIRSIRNKFAHRIEPLTFDDPLIAPLVDKLGPNYIDFQSRREAFLGLMTLALMLIHTTGIEDIRIKHIEHTHPHVYIEMLKRLYPEMSATVDQAWKDYESNSSS